MSIYEIFEFGVDFFVLVGGSQQMELSCSHNPLFPSFLFFAVVVCFFLILFNAFILQCNNISIVLEFIPFHADQRIVFLLIAHLQPVHPQIKVSSLCQGMYCFLVFLKQPADPTRCLFAMALTILNQNHSNTFFFF